MCDIDEMAVSLSRHRYDQALDDMDSAHILFDAGKYRVANNRAYYAIFHCLRAVLALDRFDSSKHSGIISEFRKRYIKEGVLPVEVSKIIDTAFEIRHDSDYEDAFVADKSETEKQISGAEYVLKVVGEFLGDKGIINHADGGGCKKT